MLFRRKVCCKDSLKSADGKVIGGITTLNFLNLFALQWFMRIFVRDETTTYTILPYH
jgi:hypothetical protein